MKEVKEKNFLSAVVYVHNNAETVSYFLKRIFTALDENFEKFEIICVNDGSTDGSVQRIKDTANTLGACALSIINMSFFQGKEIAMTAGVNLAIGDFVFEFDSDYIDYNLKTVMDVYLHALSGYDIVAATNTKERLVSKLFYRFYNKNANAQYKLGSEIFRILSRRAINRIHSMSKTVPYRKALYANCGLKIDTIIYEAESTIHRPDTKEQSKNKQDTAMSTLILFTDAAYKGSMLMTMLMMLATVAGAIYTLFVFAMGKPVAGYTTTMLVLTGSFFGVFAILAIIIKYLSILVDLVFKKQQYMVESIEKIAK